MDNSVGLDETWRIPVLKRLCVKGLFPQIFENETEYYYENSEDIFFLFNFMAMVNNDYIMGCTKHFGRSYQWIHLSILHFIYYSLYA